MNVCILIKNCRPTADGRTVLTIDIETSTGFEIETDVEVDILSSSVLMNNKIIDQAKGILIDQGLTVVVQDNFKVFGGAS